MTTIEEMSRKIVALQGQVTDLQRNEEIRKIRRDREFFCKGEAPPGQQLPQEPGPQTYNLRDTNELYAYLKTHQPEWFSMSDKDKQKVLASLPPRITIHHGRRAMMQKAPGSSGVITIQPKDLPS